jgi:hypothetical protein
MAKQHGGQDYASSRKRAPNAENMVVSGKCL